MSESEFDYYQVLGIEPTATADEIRQAYRRLARRYHPDSNPEWEDDEQANRRMARLNEAYAILRDPVRRAEYDRQRWARIQQRMQQVRYYEQARAQQTWKNPDEQIYTRTSRQSEKNSFAESQQRQPGLVFVPPIENRIIYGSTLLVFSIIFLGIWGKYIFWPGILFGAGLFIVGALQLMAALPYFQEYIVLTQDRLIEHSTFGLWPPREYLYDQICDVREQVFGYKRPKYYVMISYFKTDKLGRLDTTWYHCRRLIRVSDHYALLHALRARARMRKLAFSRPTLGARLVEMGDSPYIPILGLIMLILFISAKLNSG